MHLRVVCPTSNTWGSREIGGELTCPNGTRPHAWGRILCTIPLHIPYKSPHISLLQTVRDREIWMFGVTILTKYQPLGEDSNGKSSHFLQHLPQVCQLGHTSDRCITTSTTSLHSLYLSRYVFYRG